MKDTLEYKILKHLKEKDNGDFIDVIDFIDDRKLLESKLKSLSVEPEKYISVIFPFFTFGGSSPTITKDQLKAKIEFNGIKHLEYIEKSVSELNLAESNIKANKLNEKNSKFNKYSTIANIIIGLLNAGLLIWQILKPE
ncbi:hypothetical protein GSB9_03186 [Flavobacteriaceae bacterium GSB9]|nr:hypothetical protein GSB9_03186 [Flavobacteriaceae bacterium GSB9]